MLLKELLVTSRRGRSYVLRTAYLAALAIYVIGVYLSLAPGGAVDDAGSYQLSDLGKKVTAYIVFFQLTGATLVSVALMSTALHEEIQRRTLTALLVTPLSDWQIVVGKFIGRLAMLLSLILLILPLLGVVRVFGGVEFLYILAATCLTFCWSALAGAFTMYVSLFCRGPFTTVMTSLGLIGAYILLTLSGPGFVLFLTNPFYVLTTLTVKLLSGGGGWFAFTGTALWPLSCALMLGPTVLCIYLTGRKLRVVAAKRLFGDERLVQVPLFDAATHARVLRGLQRERDLLSIQTSLADMASPRVGLPASASTPPPLPAVPPPLPAWMPPPPLATPPPIPRPPLPEFSAEVPRPDNTTPPTRRTKRHDTIRSVRGSPILWKELRRQPLRHISSWLVVLGLVYALLTAADTITSRITQAVMIDVLLGLAVATLVLLLAGTLAGERESRSLTALLTTPMSDWRILRDKSAAAFLNAWPAWGLLAAHLLIFLLLGVLHPAGLALATLAMLSVVGLHLGAGLWLGSKLKRPAAVLMGNGLLAVTLWAGLPGVIAVLNRILPWNGWDMLLDSNPFVQIYVAVTGASWNTTPMLQFLWQGHAATSFAASALITAGWSAFYLTVATAMILAAKRNLRRESE